MFQIKKYKYKKWFTLVELIIVITILAILSVIAFTSFQNYLWSAKDSKRLANIKAIEKGLELFYVKTARYPKPEGENISEWTIDGKVYVLRGEIGQNIISQIHINTLPIDPDTEHKYIYATMGEANDEYQIATILEKNTAYQSIIPHVYAKDYQARVDGKYKWFLKYQTLNCIAYANIPSLIWSNSWSVNLLWTWEINIPNYVVNNWQNLPYHSNNKLWNLKPNEVVQILRNEPSTWLITICEDDLKAILEKTTLDSNEQIMLANFWVQNQENLKNKILSDKIKVDKPYVSWEQSNNEVICDEWYHWLNCLAKSVDLSSLNYNNIVRTFSPITLSFGSPITQTWLQYPIVWWVKELTITLTLASDGQTIEYSNGNESISCNNWFTLVWLECKRNIIAYNGWKRWSDETYAKSCNEYRSPNGNYAYVWEIWDGIYFIKPSTDPAFKVYCDMTRDGGWWTLVVRATSGNYNHRNINAVGSFLALWQTTTFKFSDSLINTIPKTIYRANNDNFSASIYFDTSDNFSSTRQVSNKVKPTYWGTIWYGPYKNNMHLWFNTIDNTPTNYWWQLTWVEWFAYTGVSGDECRRWFAIKWVNGWYCPIGNWENWYIFLK